MSDMAFKFNYEQEAERLSAENAALRTNYETACKLVADMHAAAMGAKVGPVVGVVEDVAALRAEIEVLRASTASVQADQRAESDRLRKDAGKDAERMDWLECIAMNGQIQIARSMLRTGYEIAVIGRDGGTTVKVYNGTLRAAIDAAKEQG